MGRRGSVTEFRGKLAGDDLELLDHVERQAGFRRVTPLDHLVRHAVHNIVDIATELPVHRQIAARGRSMHAVGEVREVEIVPPVQRHCLDLLLIHRQAQFRLARLEDGRGTMYGGCLGHRRQLEREVDHRLRVRLKHQACTLLRGKPCELDRDAVFTDHRKGDEVIAATVVGRFCPDETGLGVLQRHRDTGQHRAGRIEHRARQIESADLPVRRGGKDGGHQDGADKATGFHARRHQAPHAALCCHAGHLADLKVRTTSVVVQGLPPAFGRRRRGPEGLRYGFSRRRW
jgi:hypothetical protein